MHEIKIGPLDPRIRVDSGLLRVLNKIAARGFVPDQVEGLTNELLQRYLAVVRKRAGLHRRYHYDACMWVERQALHMLTTSNNDPLIREMQRALDDLDANNYQGSARQTLRDAIEGRDKLLSEIQTHRRSRPNKLNPLEREIVRILKRNTDQTWREVLTALEARVGNGVICAVDRDGDEGVIVYNLRSPNGHISDATVPTDSRSIATLPDIVGRLKKRIQSGEL
jgi:hypothetical protein